MVLSYEFYELVQNKQNIYEIIMILEKLDRDILTSETFEEHNKSLERLQELGEMELFMRIQ